MDKKRSWYGDTHKNAYQTRAIVLAQVRAPSPNGNGTILSHTVLQYSSTYVLPRHAIFCRKISFLNLILARNGIDMLVSGLLLLFCSFRFRCGGGSGCC